MNQSSSLSLEALSEKDTTVQILVIDDEPAILNAIKRQVLDLPVNLLTATKLETAHEILNTYTIDIAFVDHQLGGPQTGLEFLSLLSQDYNNCFRVIFTGESDFSFAVEAINKGHIDAFLPKPWSVEQLHALIRQGAASSHLRFMNDALKEELSQRNFELECLNKNLETIVANRTEELADTNHKLHMYQDDIVRLETQAAISQLVRGLAHELNNPLGIILGHSQRLKRLNKGNDDIKDCMDIVESEIERCRHLVERLRNYSVPDDGSAETCTVKEICKIATERLDQRGIAFPKMKIERNIPMFKANAQSMARAFDQIFENAHHAHATHVHISHEIKHERLLIHIDNNGENPSDEELRHAVKPFYSTKTSSTGLGLSVSAAILAEHGFTFCFTHNPKGTGARCTLTIPNEETNRFESSKILPSVDIPTLLILDDEPLITELILEAIKEQPLKAIACTSIREARNIIDEQDISFCIVDASLPDGSGCDFITDTIKQRPQLKRHIALITGNPNQDSVIQLQEQINCPILSKPFNMSDLNELVQQILRKHDSDRLAAQSDTQTQISRTK